MGMQLNEASFVGTPGWVLKPTHMRGLPEGRSRRMKLLGHVYGVSSSELYDVCVTRALGETRRRLVPRPEGTTKFRSYVRVQLIHSERTREWKTKSRRGETPHGNTGVDLVWDEEFQFSYDCDELVFLR